MHKILDAIAYITLGVVAGLLVALVVLWISYNWLFALVFFGGIAVISLIGWSYDRVTSKNRK